MTHGHRQSVPEAAQFVQGDTGDAPALDEVFSEYKIEAVMHFAAFIEAQESMQLPGRYFRNNVANSLTLLEAMVKHNIKRIVFSSSAAVYANRDEPLDEEAPIGPSNAYGETKLAVERMLKWFNRAHELRYCALRYFNACGAVLDGNGKPIHGEAHQPESHLIPLTLQVPLGQRESLSLFGTDYDTLDGTCVRDYIHLSDLVSAHMLALEALDDHDSMTYNLGTGQGHSNGQVIEVARKVSGHPIPVKETDRRPGDPATLVASAEKIYNELGWRPQYTNLDEIIASAWAWHRKYPDGYQT